MPTAHFLLGKIAQANLPYPPWNMMVKYPSPWDRVNF